MAVVLEVVVDGATSVLSTNSPLLGTVSSLPPGGSTGWALVKASATDFDVEWALISGGGGGGGGTITSVNGYTDAVIVLDKDDIGLGLVPNLDFSNAVNITTGVLSIARIPTGTSGSTVALGNHGHAIAEITNLQTTLNAKAAAGSNSDITALNALSTPITVAQGGNGVGTYTIGDILYASGAAAFTKLAAVATGNSLISGGAGTAPAWGKIGLTTHVSGTLPAASGGTGQASYTIGDILFASGATALSRLAGVATGNALISGGVGTAPTWGKIDLASAVSGIAPVANGGTGRATSTTAYGLIAAGITATGAHQTLTTGTTGQILKSNGSAALPTFQTGVPGDVGLGNVSNLASADLPISTATQTALDLKAEEVHAHAATDIVSGILDIERVSPGATITVDYVKTTFGKAANSWPVARPTARTDVTVIWKGPTDPGIIAINGDDWHVTT